MTLANLAQYPVTAARFLRFPRSCWRRWLDQLMPLTGVQRALDSPLAGALGISPVKTADDGSVDIKIGFSEPRQDGMCNAMIASVLEHGRSNQPARSFISATKNAVKAPATQAMVDAFNQEVDGL